MATNHHGHFLLTLLLFPELEKAEVRSACTNGRMNGQWPIAHAWPIHVGPRCPVDRCACLYV